MIEFKIKFYIRCGFCGRKYFDGDIEQKENEIILKPCRYCIEGIKEYTQETKNDNKCKKKL